MNGRTDSSTDGSGDAIAPPQYRGLGYAQKNVNVNVEISVFCAFCKDEMDDDINTFNRTTAIFAPACEHSCRLD